MLDLRKVRVRVISMQFWCMFLFLMRRRPPRTTRTATLFPSTALVRSAAGLFDGEAIGGRARLMPPPTANLPGGYDFAQRAWFDGIGAVGTVLGDRKSTRLNSSH